MDCVSLSEINGLTNFKTNKVLNMKNMFHGCSNLRSLNISSFKIQSDCNVRNILFNCAELREITMTKRGYNAIRKEIPKHLEKFNRLKQGYISWKS